MCTYVHGNVWICGCGSQRSTIGPVPWEMSLLLSPPPETYIAAWGLGVRPGCWPASPKDALSPPLQDWDRTFYATTPGTFMWILGVRLGSSWLCSKHLAD